MRNIIKRFLCVFSAFVLSMSLIEWNRLIIETAAEYSAGSLVAYGSYPQAKVTEPSLILSLNAKTPDAENNVVYEGIKYKRVYFTEYTPSSIDVPASAEYSQQDDNGYFINTVYWFKYEPIQWRILSNTNGVLFVMAEKILNSKARYPTRTDVTWDISTIREWLNSDFYNEAFSVYERSNILTSNVVNIDHPVYGTEGGSDTADKLFFLSFEEASDPAYGFNPDPFTEETGREAYGTDYSKCCGLEVKNFPDHNGTSNWWLRSPGKYLYYAGIVMYNGIVTGNADGVHAAIVGVRPVFKINKTSLIYSSGKTVEFGSYPQTKITDATLIAKLDLRIPDADNTVTCAGCKYKKVCFSQYTPYQTNVASNAENSFQDDNGYFADTVYWFKYEPIKWRILSNTGGELFLLSEKISVKPTAQ